jgi:hypothetical protein
MSTKGQKRTPRSVSVILSEVGDGTVHDEASERFAALFEAVAAGYGKGSIVITLKVEPGANKNLNALSVTGVVTAKVPTEAPRPTVLFVGHDGEPSRDNPQMSLAGMEFVAADAERIVVRAAENRRVVGGGE